MQMKSLSEIAVNLITHIHDTIPEADTKEGTFIRDIFVDPIASEIASLYRETKLVELAQSILSASGSELDKLAKNYFVERKGSTEATGRLRFYLGTAEPTYEILINRGTLVSTIEKATNGAKYYVTSDNISIIPGDYGTYQKDISTGKWYVDVDAVSQQQGSEYNVAADTITQIASSLDPKISEVTNSFAFSGGTDAEDDISLILRMSLVISGSNIGTKDGYLSFILSQSEVLDAVVVGAREPLMKRDNGEGGMVDIYVRAEATEVDNFNFQVDYDYITENIGKPAYADIKLRRQPVLHVTELTGEYPDATTEDGVVKKFYVNGSSFKTEKGTLKYYEDIPWDTSFRDVPTDGLKDDELLKAEATNTLNAKLKRFLVIKDIRNNVYYDKKLVDVSYNTDFNKIDPTKDAVLPIDLDFYRGYNTNNSLQLILSKYDSTNSLIGGRYFLQKDGKLFERVYYQPDFIVFKDTGNYGNSISANDAIRWLSNSTRSNLPRVGENLSITYSYNILVSDLQEKVEAKRVLTADVLIKSAKKVPIEVKLDVVPNISIDPETVRKTIVNKLTSYINEQVKMGGTIDRSDIAYIARGTDGIDAVKLDSIYIALEDQSPIAQISLKQLEYMQLVNIYVRVLAPGSIV